MSWFDVVVSDLTQLPNALTYYEQELQNAKQEVNTIKGGISP